MQYLCVIKQFSFAKIAVCCILGDLLFAKVELELSPPTLQYSNYISVYENQLLDFIENLKENANKLLYLININFHKQFPPPQSASQRQICPPASFFSRKGKVITKLLQGQFPDIPSS